MFSFNTDLVTKGYIYKLLQTHVNPNFRKHFFTHHIISVWNSLSDQVVSANNINSLKNKLDSCMNNQDLSFDWKAKYEGAGSRSQTQESVNV